MYALFPLKPLFALLIVIIAIIITYVDDLFALIGVTVPDTVIVRYVPVVLVVGLTIFFGPTGYWAPWRFVWRKVPRLNAWLFPDLNGIWVGTTSSDWPTIKTLVDATQSTKQITEKEPDDTPSQCNVMAVEITNNLFAIQIDAGQCSTNDWARSISARPWRNPIANLIHISYVYQQFTRHAMYLGLADLELVNDDFSEAEGTYWTQREGLNGRNQAGTLRLEWKQARKDTGKSLKEHAAEYCPKHSPGGNGDPPPEPDSRVVRLLKRLGRRVGRARRR